jgi:hypothetical protein
MLHDLLHHEFITGVFGLKNELVYHLFIFHFFCLVYGTVFSSRLTICD